MFNIDPDSLHIALATYPQGSTATEYKKAIENLFTEWYENSKKFYAVHVDDEIFYAPQTYHMFGCNDIAFLTLLDNHKYTQKGFFPKGDFGPHSFQIINGVCPIINPKAEIPFSLKGFFENKNKDKGKDNFQNFIGICNMKLNNGFLIGNGQVFLEEVISLIKTEIDKLNDEIDNSKTEDKAHITFILNQSFSWFEISLVVFATDVNIISKLITRLRKKKILELGKNKEIIENSLYKTFNENTEHLENTHIFGDTHTHFGVKFDYIADKEIKTNPNFNTETEWQVKPGHISELINELKELEKNDDKIFNTSAPLFITGKNDYIIKENKPSDFSNNQKLFKMLRIENKEDSFNYVKKVRTKLLLATEETEDNVRTVNDTREFNNLNKKLKEFIKKNDVEKWLKALKVSRQVTEKILKIYFNYHSGIQDTILFTYFIDFTAFIEKLTAFIEGHYEIVDNYYNPNNKKNNDGINEIPDNSDDFIKKSSEDINKIDENIDKREKNKNKFPSAVEEIERNLKIYIDAFEEGFHLRMLNSYQFEEIYDFDLDFNSSIQQILSTYNTIGNVLSGHFYSKEYSYSGQLVQLNMLNTESSELVLNYNVHHLTSPGFVFFTIDKEILNSLSGNSKKDKKRINKLKKWLKAHANPYLAQLIKDKFIDAEYLYIDIIRVMNTFAFDVKLFEYWFWLFTLQETSLYTTRGLLDERHFKKELMRLMLLVKIFNPDHISKMKCPTPELYSYWHRHFESTRESIEFLFKDENVNDFKNVLKNIFEDVLKFYKTDFATKNNRKILADDTNNEEIKKLFEPVINLIGNNNIDCTVRDVVKYFRNNYKEPISDKDNLLKAEDISSENAIFYIYSLMYNYLKFFYDKSGGQIFMLKRDWKTGSALENFITADRGKDNESPPFYYTDPFGAIFFTDKAKSDEYYKIRNNTFRKLWHFANLIKKDFITQKTKKNEKT